MVIVNKEDEKKKKKKLEGEELVDAIANLTRQEGVNVNTGETVRVKETPVAVPNAKPQLNEQELAVLRAKVGARQDALAEIERRKQFVEATDLDTLKENLKDMIINQPSMKPDIKEGTGDAALNEIGGSRLFQPLGITGVSATKKLLEDPEKELTRAGFELLGGASLGALSTSFLTTTAATTAAKTGILGTLGSVPLLKVAIEGAGLYIFGKGILDYQGGQIQTMRDRVQRVVEDGERLEALVRNGMPPEEAIIMLKTMAEEVEEAEKRIRELGVVNVQYRVNKEYLKDQSRMRSARKAIYRRLLAVENIAATGQASLNPEELLFIASQINQS